MNDTRSLQPWSTTGVREHSIIQNINEPIRLVSDSSINILNSHYTGTESCEFIKFKHDITNVALALGSAYKNTIDSINLLFNPSKRETSQRSNSIFFEEIKWGNHKIRLNRPVSMEIIFSGDFWEASNEDLGIYLAASNIEQLNKDFQEEFFVMWDVYSKKPDAKLTEKAKEIKYKILNLVIGVSVEG